MTIGNQGLGAALVFAFSCAAACRAAPAQGPAHTAPDTAAVRSRIVLSQALPRLEGERLELTVVEVTYGPGGASSPHRHPCPVVGYVLEGALRNQVKGEADSVYHAGESFYEEPNGVHLVSANASRKEPVRFLAYFTCDRDTPLSVAVPEAARTGRER